MTGSRDAKRDPWRDPPVLAGLLLVLAVVVIVVTRERPDSTLVGTLLAGAAVMLGVKVAQLRNGGPKE